MSDLGIGYWDHGVGMLDPERYWPRDVECARCGEPEYPSSMSDDYGDFLICEDCKKAIESIALKVKYAQHHDHIIEFFKWVLEEALIFTPEIVKPLFEDYIETGTIGYEEWCISGKGRNL